MMLIYQILLSKLPNAIIVTMQTTYQRRCTLLRHGIYNKADYMITQARL